MGIYKKYLYSTVATMILLGIIPSQALAVSSLTFEEINTDIPVTVGEHILVSPFGYGQPEANYPTFADIDKDDDMDLFIGTGDGTIIYYKNIGTPTEPHFVLTNRKFLGIDKNQFILFPAFADTDNDGDLDLYFGEWGGKLNFYKNRGNPIESDLVYAQGAETAVDVKNFAAPEFVDIDADGDLDLFVGSFEGSIFYYENAGTPTKPQYILTSNTYKDISYNETVVPRFVDIDNDGDFDMFIGSDNGKVAYYKNTGGEHTPQFALTNDSYFEVDPSYVYPAFVDIDADGDFDMFLGNNLGQMHFYKNTGTKEVANFTKITDEYFHLDIGSHSNIDFADIDNDSDLDLFMTNGNNEMYFFENTNTTVNPTYELNSTNFLDLKKGANAFRFVDIDGDEDLDLVIGYLDILSADNAGKIDLYKNIGSVRTPKFLLVENYFDGIDVGSASAPELFDYDNDGDLDLFIGNNTGVIYLYKNEGDNKNANFVFTNNKFEDINVDGYAKPRFADMDNDGDNDLLVGNKHGRVFYIENVTGNVGHNYLKIGEITDDLGDYTSLAPLDSNNDSKMDFFVGSADGNIHHFIQTSKNLFPPENVTKLNAKVTDQGIMTISWNASLNSEKDLKEYRLYQKTGNENFIGSTGVGKVTSVTIIQPNKYLTYGFKVTAIDESGLQNDGIEIQVKFENNDYSQAKVTKIEKPIEVVTNAPTEFCSGFPDVKKSSVTQSMCDAIEFVKDAGIFGGTAEGKLELERPINRAEVTKVLMEAFDIELEAPVVNEFLDVDSTQWYAPYIHTAKVNGIVEGYENRTFKPGQTINKVELLKVVLEMAKSDFSAVDIGTSLYDDIEATAENEWFIKYTNFAHDKGLLDSVGNTLNPGEDMTRQDVIQLLYRMKQQELINI